LEGVEEMANNAILVVYLTTYDFLRTQQKKERLVCSLMGRRVIFGESTLAVHKFLVLECGVLIIGPYRSHIDLFSAGIDKGVCLKDTQVVAAGNVGRDGKVIDWQSEGYHLQTPQEMMSDIENAIAELVRSDIDHTKLPLPPEA
jgi:hypothetical protein